MKLTEIIKPSDLGEFIRLQLSSFEPHQDMEKIQFLARLDHQQHYLAAKPVIELIALYEISCLHATHIALLVSDRCEQVLSLFEQGFTGQQIAQQLGLAWIELHKGLLLQPIHIAKPWGQEIWYTGIEQRGVSRVQSDEGSSPLDYAIAAAPDFILGDKEDGTHNVLTLLKILDPLPDEVFGDLYFEMHEEKQEVYVVTHIDQQAWPQGTGGIRFGFNQALRKTFASDHDFKRTYLQAVRNYQQVRQKIDVLLDAHRAAEKIGANDPVMPAKIKQWQELLPGDLMSQEKKLREIMENFIAVKHLQLGDVVRVPCFTPHSLQHGVRTVEFQTPVYERKILSFAQKVLTQSHWDTEEALQKINLDVPQEKDLVMLEKTDKFFRERVVQFDDFKVERVTFAGKAGFFSPQGHYRLVLVVTGELVIEGLSLHPGQAQLLPANTGLEIDCVGTGAVMLLAEPL